MFHPCFTNQFLADHQPTVGRLLAICQLTAGQPSVDSRPAVGQQYLLGTVLHSHPVIEDQSRESEDLGFNTSWETHSFSLSNAWEKPNCTFFSSWYFFTECLYLSHTKIYDHLGKLQRQQKLNSGKKLYLVSKCKRLLYYHAYLVFYWKNTVCKLS